MTRVHISPQLTTTPASGGVVPDGPARQETVVNVPLRFRTRTVSDYERATDPRPRLVHHSCTSCGRQATGDDVIILDNAGDHKVQITVSFEFKNLTIGDFEMPRGSTPPSSPELEEALVETFRHRRVRRKAVDTKHESSKVCPSNIIPRTWKTHRLPFKSAVPSSAELYSMRNGPRRDAPLGQQSTQTGIGGNKYHVLVDRVDMNKLLFPINSPKSAYSFWSWVDTVYVNVSSQLNWDAPSSIESRLVVGQLFSNEDSVMIPLRDIGRVDHAWELLSLSNEPEVVRLREELEKAASAVHGPEASLPFPYREETRYDWKKLRNRYMWLWLYMRYLGQPWGIPWNEIWEEHIINGQKTLKAKYSWVHEELQRMAKVEEVMFISLPGFVPPPGTSRSNPAMMVLTEDRTHVPISNPPGLIQCSEWDTFIEVPPYAWHDGKPDLSQGKFVTVPFEVR